MDNMREQRGVISILVIVLSLVFLAMGLALAKVAITEINITAGFQAGIAAQYIAQAGIYKAIYCLDTDHGWQGTESFGEKFNEGSTAGVLRIHLYRDDRNNFVVVQSVGTVGSAERMISFAYVWPPGGSDNPAYNYALFAGGNLSIFDAASVNGLQVGSRKNVYIGQQNIADFSHKQEIIVPPVPTLPDRLLQDKILAAPPSERDEASNALTGRVYLYQNQNGFLYKIKSYQTLSGNGVIYSAETIEIGENVHIPSRVVMVSEGGIIIGKNAILDQALLVARQNIDVKEGVKLTGCVVAGNEMQVGRNAVITYDPHVKAKIKTNYWFD